MLARVSIQGYQSERICPHWEMSVQVLVSLAYAITLFYFQKYMPKNCAENSNYEKMSVSD